jgi:hypothetical protein
MLARGPITPRPPGGQGGTMCLNRFGVAWWRLPFYPALLRGPRSPGPPGSEAGDRVGARCQRVSTQVSKTPCRLRESGIRRAGCACGRCENRSRACISHPRLVGCNLWGRLNFGPAATGSHTGGRVLRRPLRGAPTPRPPPPQTAAGEGGELHRGATGYRLPSTLPQGFWVGFGGGWASHASPGGGAPRSPKRPRICRPVVQLLSHFRTFALSHSRTAFTPPRRAPARSPRSTR